jgi:hypothetical protein
VPWGANLDEIRTGLRTLLLDPAHAETPLTPAVNVGS